MDTIAPKRNWRSRLIKLLDEHPDTLTGMGFPANWQQMSIWQDLNPSDVPNVPSRNCN